MFGLSPLVEILGGKLTSDSSGESVTLRIAETDVVLGPGNAIVTVGDSITSLSQPPAHTIKTPNAEDCVNTTHPDAQSKQYGITLDFHGSSDETSTSSYPPSPIDGPRTT